jgi:co-chaperonin GroES (HSP10)
MTPEQAIRERAARGDFDRLPAVPLRMVEDNVLVLMDHLADPRTERITAGGIVVPRSADKPPEGDAVPATVLACAERWFETSHLERRGTDGVMVKRRGAWRYSDFGRGDRVLVDKAYQGDVYELPDGREARVVRQFNVIGVIE